MINLYLTLELQKTEEEYGEFLQNCMRGKDKSVELFADIETLAYNTMAENPKDRKNETYSVAVAWWGAGSLPHWVAFPSFEAFFHTNAKYLVSPKTGKKLKRAPKVTLYFHNGNRYDHHYLLAETKRDYPQSVRLNRFQRNAIDSVKMREVVDKDITLDQREKGAFLESRVRASTNLDMTFYLENIKYITVDTLPKTTLPLKQLGLKLVKKKLLPPELAKQDETFNYSKYDKQHDMAEREAKLYTKEVFEQLTDEELVYIGNDVIILAMVGRYYELMYHDKKWSDMTLNVGIKNSYIKDSSLAALQMVNATWFQEEDKKRLFYQPNYQSFGFYNYRDKMLENFYSYLRGFYRGGMNLYNDHYIGQVLHFPAFSIDINSSYPYIMYKFKFPTFLLEHNSYKEPTLTLLNTENTDFFFEYRLDVKTFNRYFISRMRSRVMRQAFTKRFINDNGFVNLTSVDIANMNRFTTHPITNIPVWTETKFQCEYFGARDKIQEYYAIKTQGKNKQKLDCSDPLDIKVIEGQFLDDNELMSDDEIYNAKKDMNAGYGLTALRPAFAMAMVNPDETLDVVQNAMVNRERNVTFAVYITTRALENLFMPLSFLSAEEIDSYFLYCDTDSLYLRREAMERIPETIYHPMNLGAWDIENHDITDFYILHHKKYAYYSKDLDKEGQEKGLVVHAGGVPDSTFNKEMDFESFIRTQFHEGVTLKAKKNVINHQGKVHIYDGTVDLQQGGQYPTELTEQDIKARRAWIERLREMENARTQDVYEDGNTTLYYESERYGTASIIDLNPYEYERQNLLPMVDLINLHGRLRYFLKES